MGRAPCCAKVGLRKGRWSAEEDQILINYIRKFGEGSWRSLPKKAGLLRCGKSCRLRWVNYLRSGIKRGNISTEERERIIQLHSELGNRWSLIASKMPGRTDNEIKNYWNTHLSKKLHTLDTPNFAPEKEVKSPQTHSDILLSSSSSSSTSTSSSLLSTSSKTCNFASCASTSRESDVSLEYDVAPDEATPTNAHNDNNEQDKNNEEEGDKKNKNNSERCMDACCLPLNFDMELQSPPPLLDHFDFEFEFRVAQEFEFGMDEENNNDHLWPF